MSERMKGMSIVEFLLARIAEDEADWRVVDAREEVLNLHGKPLAPKMLAECEAKRRIIDLHDGPHECSTYDHTGDVDNCTWCLNTEDCSTMRLLASVYAKHPDYNDAWRATPDTA